MNITGHTTWMNIRITVSVGLLYFTSNPLPQEITLCLSFVPTVCLIKLTKNLIATKTKIELATLSCTAVSK